MSLTKKLFLKSGYRYHVANAPEGFELPVNELDGQVERIDKLDGELDFVLLFVKSQEELGEWAPQVLPHLRSNATLWVAYPKKSSKIKSDIHRDAGWDALWEQGYRGVSLISIDDTWSAMRFKVTQS